MKEKTKKWLVIAGLAVVCIGLIFGISRVLYKEPVTQAKMSEQETEETKVTVEMENPDTPQTEAVEPDTEEPLVIEVQTENTVNDKKQEIQPDPEKTEDEKPSEAPALAEGTDTDNPDTPPAYEETKEPEQQPSTDTGTPKTGDTKDGMVYVEGFGWIPDEGEGSGTYAEDMYENGNKIGIMD